MFPELNSIKQARIIREQYEEARAEWLRRVEHYREAVRNGLNEMQINRYAFEANQAFRLSEKLDAAMLGQRDIIFD